MTSCRAAVVLGVLIAAGCSDRHHPDNFVGGAVHGPALKQQTEDCRECHGDDLTGGTSGVSCDGCHTGATTTAWRSNCTFCHGGVQTDTGAPPRNIDGTDLIGPFPGHTVHVTGSAFANAYDCTQCHVKANDVLSPGHVFDASPGEAENDYGAGLSPQAAFDRTTGTCSNVYCHGTGRTDDGVVERDASVGCDGCHAIQSSDMAGWRTMSGPHAAHLGAGTGMTCVDCHGMTTTDGETIASKDLHINGQRDVTFTTNAVAFSQTRKQCTGACHGFDHNGLVWIGEGGVYHPAGFSAGNVHGTELELQRQDCRGCHGDQLTGGTGPSCDGCHPGPTTTAWRTNCTFCHGGGLDLTGAPPRDLGSSIMNASQSFVAHRKHVAPVMMTANDCTTCHIKPVDAMSIGHVFDATPMTAEIDLQLDGRNPMGSYTSATGTCANLYCHGNGQVNGSFTDGLTATCTSCHGGAANNRAGLTKNHRDHHDKYACAECHQGVVATGSAAITTPALHVNRAKDVKFLQGGTYDLGTKTCSGLACHGTERW